MPESCFGLSFCGEDSNANGGFKASESFDELRVGTLVFVPATSGDNFSLVVLAQLQQALVGQLAQVLGFSEMTRLRLSASGSLSPITHTRRRRQALGQPLASKAKATWRIYERLT